MIGCVGVIDNIERVVATTWNDGDEILVLGTSATTLGGSEYLELFHDVVGGQIPTVDFAAERNLHEALVALAGSGLLSGAQDVSLGGLAVTLAELAISTGVGATTDGQIDGRVDRHWFGESSGRVVVSVSPEAVPAVNELVSMYGVPINRIGTASGTSLHLGDAPAVPVDDLKIAFETGLSRASSTVVVSSTGSD
jgi:phosphoribosylformylglycinamidine synthase